MAKGVPESGGKHPDREMIALGIRQPWAELIIRGVKTVEVRSSNTNVRGRIYVYAGTQVSEHEAAVAAARRAGISIGALPRGVIVGTVRLVGAHRCSAIDAEPACVPTELLEEMWGWELAEAERIEPSLKIRFRPYGVWFYPFQRKPALPEMPEKRVR